MRKETKVEVILAIIAVLIIVVGVLISTLYFIDPTNEIGDVEQNCRAFCNTYAGMGYDSVNELGECLCWKDSLTIYGNHSYVTNRTQNYGIINAFYQKS